MPWSPSAIAGAGVYSLLHYTICIRHPVAELYNDGTLVKSLSAVGCTLDTITNGGYVNLRFSDTSTEAYTFNKIVLKRDPYTAPDGSRRNIILTVDIPEGKIKTADRALSFFIRLYISTIGG